MLTDIAKITILIQSDDTLGQLLFYFLFSFADHVLVFNFVSVSTVSKSTIVLKLQ